MDYILKDKLDTAQELRIDKISNKDEVELSIYGFDCFTEGRTIRINLYELIEALCNYVPEPPEEPQNKDVE